MAPKLSDRVHNPYHLEGPQCFTTEEKMSNGPQVGILAT